MPNMPRIALLVETSRGYGRGILQGIIRYARLHGPWSFYITPGDFEQALPAMKQWGGTGIIARIETPQTARAIRATGLPVVCLDYSAAQAAMTETPWKVSEVHPDPVASIDLAIEHLVGRAFKRLAFVGIPGRIWSDQRQAAFAQRVKQQRRARFIYKPPRAKRDREWDREQEMLGQWLKDLPKPVGLVACNDDRGRQVLEAAMAAGVQVPDEVAVVGIDNDEVLCELSTPPLSSVMLNTDKGGYEIAELLDGLMSGRVRGPRQLTVEPLWVITRRSTDALGIDDREVAAALRFIRENRGRPFGVGDILQEICISRRSLELRFQKTLRRSVRQEIQNVHLEWARQLLAETDMALPNVAQKSGFSTASYLGQVFRKRYGVTPSQYRKRISQS